MIKLKQYNDPNNPYAFVNPQDLTPRTMPAIDGQFAPDYSLYSPNQNGTVITAPIGSNPIPTMGVDLTQMQTPLDDVTNNLLNPKQVNPMALMGLAQGLLGADEQPQQAMPMPSAPMRQGGNYANAYKQYLNDFGLLGSK